MNDLPESTDLPEMTESVEYKQRMEQLFNDLESKSSSIELVDQLIQEFEHQSDWHSYFRVKCLELRIQLGLDLFDQNETSADPTAQNQYEENLEDICRDVGNRFLQQDDLVDAFRYFSLSGDIKLVQNRLKQIDLSSVDNQEKYYSYLELMIHQKLNQVKGLEWVLDRMGICEAISTCENIFIQSDEDTRIECAKLLVGNLYEELHKNVKASFEELEKDSAAVASSESKSIKQMLDQQPDLTAEEQFHIDVSHLHAVVRFARVLPRCQEVEWVLDLSYYGSKLSQSYQFSELCPFDEGYIASVYYFETILDRNVNEHLNYFHEKINEETLQETGTFPVEVYSQLLRQCGEYERAIEILGSYLNGVAHQSNLCPSIDQICIEANRFDLLCLYAKDRNDPTTYAAAKSMLLDSK